MAFEDAIESMLMNKFKQWFQSLTTGLKIVIVVGILMYVTAILGFAAIGIMYNLDIVIFPIVICILAMVLDIMRMMD
jgi:hypothetical protein